MKCTNTTNDSLFYMNAQSWIMTDMIDCAALHINYSVRPPLVSWGQWALLPSCQLFSQMKHHWDKLEPLCSLWTSAIFFLSHWLSCTDNTELAFLRKVSFTLFFLVPLFPTLFNHFSAVGSFYFPFVSFCQFGFLLYNNINPLVLWFFRLLLCSLTCYTCFSNFKTMC